jgi:hypothetical protein
MGHWIGKELGLGEGKVGGLIWLIGWWMSWAAEDDLLRVQYEEKIFGLKKTLNVEFRHVTAVEAQSKTRF